MTPLPDDPPAAARPRPAPGTPSCGERLDAVGSPRFTAWELSRLLGEDHAPTAQQAEVIEAPLTPTLVVAGAGSGKTATMAARVVWLTANGYVRPEQILGVTFTRKAAAELSHRIRHRLARLAGALDDDALFAGEPTVSTYHSYASRVVAEHGLRAGYEPNSRMLSEAASWQLVDSVVRGYDGDMSAVDRALSTVVEDVRGLAGELAEHLCTPADLEAFTEDFAERLTARVPRLTADMARILAVQRARRQLLPLVTAYRRRKADLEAGDFADLMERAALLAAEIPEVGAAERDRYRVVLLDEYQDTSHAQVVLLRSLFGDGHPVTAVGDPCQSIYGWRGASSGTLRRFPAAFAAEGTEVRRHELTVSWRNRAAILTAANRISEPLRGEGHLVSALEPGAPGEGEVRCALLPTAVEEAEHLAGSIEAIWGAGWAKRPPDDRPSTAVLVRKRAQIPLLEKALADRGLPVEVVGVGGLLDVPEVREIYCVLRALADPTAGSPLIRLLTGPRWRLGPRDLVALYRRAAEIADAHGPGPSTGDSLDEAALAEAVDDPGDPDAYSPHAYPRITALRDELAELRSRLHQPLPELIADIERTTGLNVEVSVHRGGRAQLDAFADLAARYVTESAASTLTGFLAYLAAAEDTERGLDMAETTVTAGAVQILTVHAAKGLEWDVVAVAGLAAGMFPSDRSRASWLTAVDELPIPLRGDAEDLPDLDLDGAKASEAVKAFKAAWSEHNLTEERRLAYVAVTRARGILLATGYWWGETGAKRRGPSKILTELAESGAHITHWADPPTDERNPLLDNPPTAWWPNPEPLGPRQRGMTEAAALVRDEVVRLVAGTPSTPDTDDPEAARWAEEAELLLAERAERSGDTIDLPLPAQLSVTQLVGIRRDRGEFAERLRRPVPAQPEPRTRRGTAFHAWVEEFYGETPLLGLDDLPGASDDDAAPDTDLLALKDAFMASEWARRAPVAVEVPFVTMVGGIPVRGRIDAVFAAPGGGFDVVDWKTGRPPRDIESRRVAAVQLAAYRQAWAQLRGVDPEDVRACFHYVAVNRTVEAGEFPDLAELVADP